VLDLDETLIHTFVRWPRWLVWFGRLRCHTKTVVLNNRFVPIHVGVRPYFSEFLAEVSELFDIAVYTAGERNYAEPILNLIDRPHKCIRERYYRSSCRMVNGIPLKDLRVTGRDLSKVVIVDNSETGYFLQPENGIPIPSWTGNPFDNELVKLLPLLRALATAEDVRPALAAKHR